MKKQVVAFLLVVMMLFAMPMTALGDPGGTGGCPPPYQPPGQLSICILPLPMMATTGDPGGTGGFPPPLIPPPN
ncbi:MAG: hypothetical protein FWC92_01520 [Defluviitaleaceae bacterium]|nr:hypothetical protein [Defluviitaleaceae bacterium]